MTTRRPVPIVAVVAAVALASLALPLVTKMPSTPQVEVHAE